jgi:4-amino-4-deoxy-L-arabinose transferase-like glycosyltransferase
MRRHAWRACCAASKRWSPDLVTQSKHIWILILLIAFGVARVAATYGTLNSTSDEPAHVDSGMEVLQFGAYTYELQHPPLARIAVAIGPYLAGLREKTHRDVEKEGFMTVFQDGNEILYANGQYWRNLALARLGVLPFFVLLCVITYAWTARWFSALAGLWAVGLLVSIPPVLGHAGLATLDLACAATVVTALYALLRWMEEPGARRAVLFGAAVAIALLVKFSSGLFLVACCLVAVVRRRPELKDAITAAAVVLVLLWAGYGFAVGSLGPVWGPHPKIDAILSEHPSFRPLWDAAMGVPVPFPKLLLGLRDVMRHNDLGHGSYLFGEYRTTGWWYFFPVVLAVKTPIGLMVLAAASIWTLATWQQKLTALFPLAILIACLPSGIDLGVRHILSIYPLLAILAASVCPIAYARGSVSRVAAVALALFVVGDSVWAHPDYVAYFNQVAGSKPERILAESDIDWGQDLDRLSQRLRELNAPEVHIKYFGSALLEKAGLPTYWDLNAQTPDKGWVAISVHYLYLEHAKDGSFDWLKRYSPRERIGKSIDLFFIE